LTAILVGSNLSDDLCCDITSRGEAVGLLDHGTGDNGTVLEHILEVYEVAVMHMLSKVVTVVEVDNTLLMSLNDILRKKESLSDVLADLTCHIVTLYAVDCRVLIGVLLLELLVVALDKGKDGCVSCIGLTDKASGIAVGYIELCNLICAVSHDLLLDEVLDLLDGKGTVHILTLIGNTLGDTCDLLRCHTISFLSSLIRLCDSVDNLGDIEFYFLLVTLNDLHFVHPAL
jgi:hypothetical protein